MRKERAEMAGKKISKKVKETRGRKKKLTSR